MTTKLKLLSAIRERFKFSVGKRLIVAGNGPRARSYDEVMEKLADDGAVMNALNEDALRTALIGGLLANDKLAVFYEIDEGQLRSAHQKFDQALNSTPGHALATAFPFTLTETALRALPLNEPVPVHLLEMEGATALLFATVRLVEKRENIDVRQLSPALTSIYQFVVGVKKQYVHAINAVVLPYAGNIAYILSDNSEKTTPLSAQLDQISLRNSANSLLGSNFFVKPINLFGAIKNLYKAPAEGDVALLSHTVADGIKHERMKRGQCVRQEDFHVGGAAAVAGDLNPYQLAVRWTVSTPFGKARPELELLGSVRMTYDLNPHLNEAVISGCATMDELQLVVAKILTYK